MPHLIVREPGRVAFTVELTDGLQVGRHPDNAVVLADRQASRQHLRFNLTAGAWVLTDLDSTHGTLVNRQRVKTRNLVDGDVVQVGNVLVTFHADEPEAARSSVYHSRTDVRTPAPAGPDPAARRLALLVELARAMDSLGDPDRLIERMLDTTIDTLECERGLVGLTDGPATAGRRFVRQRGNTKSDEEIIVPRPVLDTMLGKKESVLIQNAVGRQSAMGAPLHVTGRVLGFIYVDDRARAARFTPAELDFLSALARLLSSALDQAAEQKRAAQLLEALREQTQIPGILGASEAMQRLKARITKYASARDANLLVHGESGTGKELVASTLHALSPRAEHPFVAVNCAAIPDTMIESELFGHEKGAFTGAVKTRRGKFSLAHKGTLFMDEVGDLSLSAQAKVLRAIEEGEISPLGSEETVSVDVRIVSATHKSLPEEIAAGRFREDLYYRLAVGEIEIPPLRDRAEDVLLLAEEFLSRAASRLGRKPARFSAAASEALRRYRWPGNVRQLQNEVERAVILSDGPAVELDDLRARIDKAGGAPAAAAGPARETTLTLAERFLSLDATEKALVDEAMQRSNGNLAEAARLLGITRVMLKRRVDRYALGDKDPSQG
jgi:Nif-specific regulatory protein